jgi:hypothetical protein
MSTTVDGYNAYLIPSIRLAVQRVRRHRIVRWGVRRTACVWVRYIFGTPAIGTR